MKDTDEDSVDAAPDAVQTRIVAPLRRIDVSLDEIRRARLAARIEDGLDAQTWAEAQAQARARTAQPAAWRRWRWRLAGGGALAGAAALVLLLVGGRAPTDPQRKQPLALVPYFYAGGGARGASLAASARLTAPAGGRVRATVGGRARITLVGPGAVVAATVAGVSELTLERGLLLVDYDGTGGPPLRVRSPGTVTTVVGTLFAVDASTPRSRVAVTRGTVTVASSGRLWRVATHQSWAEGDAGPGQVPLDLNEALSEHDRSPPPPVGDYQVLTVDRAGSAATVIVDQRYLGESPLSARIAHGSEVQEPPTPSAPAPEPAGATGDVAAAAVPFPSPAPIATAPERRKSRRLATRGAGATGANRPVTRDDAGAVKEAPPARQPASPPKTEPARAPQAAEGDVVEAAYLAAEGWLLAGETGRARAALRQLIRQHPNDPLVETALIDLARLALRAGDLVEARRHLSRLADPPRDPALREPAQHLRCQLDPGRAALTPCRPGPDLAPDLPPDPAK